MSAKPLSKFPYLVRDIEAEMQRIREGAAIFGWHVTHNWRDLSEPRLFPEIPEEQLLAAVKAAFRRDCNRNCDICGQPHPLLQIAEGSHVKLCTRVAEKLFRRKLAERKFI